VNLDNEETRYDFQHLQIIYWTISASSVIRPVRPRPAAAARQPSLSPSQY